ncbi:TetR family transcriptional regulator [Brachybacterium phenoliresistens]|uniref:TetR family transcriptional regulator n=1 Tax=Brachybacterium phenoliresistens TaxID=396014 RepID=Z9JPY3_9MICO|nr:TetR family transcriptional regulator [Brachybacterium phenoliresistens]EWS79851.1 TetR family transcriptional regulator [Brachybacterium phenoliresistens]
MATRTGGAGAAPEANEALRAQIVRAADALYYSRGITAVGMDEVRSTAGVSLKRLYALFPGKESLILAVLRHRHGIWEQGVEAAVAAAGSPRGRVLAVFDFLAEWFTEESFRGCGFVNAFGEMGPGFPSIAQYVREHKEGFQARMAELVREAGLPEQLAPQLALLAEGAQTTAAILGTAEPAEHARAAAETLLDASDATAGARP